MKLRRILVSLALASAFSLLPVLPAVADEGSPERETDGGAALALGDSVAFGYNPLLDFRVASNFVGYPEVVSRRLDLRDVNASCPGEATGGFLNGEKMVIGSVGVADHERSCHERTL